MIIICNYCSSHKEDKIEKLLHECLRCLKAFMNNTMGLKLVLEQSDGMFWIDQYFICLKYGLL